MIFDQLRPILERCPRPIGEELVDRSRCYDGIAVSDEPEVQWERLRYVLAGDQRGTLA